MMLNLGFWVVLVFTAAPFLLFLFAVALGII
jgi:hypothetical protein